MKPSSLAGILLELIEEVARPGPYPADARVGRFLRSRRYLGSHDRRFLGDAVYGWLRFHLRGRARWRAWCERHGIEPPRRGETAERSEAPSATATHVLDLVALARDHLLPWTAAELREALRSLEKAVGPDWERLRDVALGEEFLSDDPWPDDPLERFSAEVGFPTWLAWRLIEERGEEGARELALSLQKPAPVDLRVNLARTSREDARQALEEDLSVGVELTHFSPLGLRLEARRNLTATRASRQSWVEVQDEGSQLAVLCAEPSRGMTIIDACAGNGGKTLAMADILLRETSEDIPGVARGRGRIAALDVAAAKLEELGRRARDADALDVVYRIVAVAPDGPLPADLPLAHLVLVDAPCSGMGTLRRNPELKMRYGPADIQRFAEAQQFLLARFAPLVRPGGRLVYVTCSFLRAECEDVAARFEATHGGFERARSEWAATRLPARAIDGGHVRVDPVVTGTDAFFIALWRRVGPTS